MELKNMNILVIEDNLGDFILVEDHLIEEFITVNVIHCIDFKTAKTYLQDERLGFDVILLDLQLPDLAGINLVEKLLPLSFTVPVIVLTGYADLQLAKKMLQYGIYDFLIKDEINAKLLFKSIEFAISRSSYIKQIETQNEKLKNIAWTQSHILRSPLSSILGIIDMIEDQENNNVDVKFWLKQLRVSANEMDMVVRNIVDETVLLDK